MRPLRANRSVALVLGLAISLAAANGAARAAAKDNPEVAAYQKGIDCINAGGDQANCMIKASPKRCEAQAVGMVSNRTPWQRDWVICIRSCQQASLWDRTIGECS